MGYAPGDGFAGYSIVRMLGKGGMGSVYLARHPRLPRHDALKLLSDSYGGDDTYRMRFEREADLAAQLSHRNIVAVYDRGSQDGRLWIAMQYVAGRDAAQALQQGPMHAARAAHIASEIGAGLHYAHLQGMVHRDVKPANILLQQGADTADPENVLLADFGIAKLDSSSSTLTGEGNFLGTLPYTAPEVLNGAPPGPSVDIYALGCVLFELLTARVPFPVSSPLAAMNAHLSTPPPKPSELVFGIPPALDVVVQRAMAKDPAERFATCRDLSVAVRAAVYVDRVADHAEPADRADSSSAADRPRPPYTLTLRRFDTDGSAWQLGPVDTSAGSPAERGALETMLRAAGFFHLPLRLPLVRRIDNDPYIELTVAGGGRERAVGFERAGSRHPIELGLIIERLEQIRGWQRTDGAGDRPVIQPSTARSQPIPVAPQPQPQPPSQVASTAQSATATSGPQSWGSPFVPAPPVAPRSAASHPAVPRPPSQPIQVPVRSISQPGMQVPGAPVAPFGQGAGSPVNWQPQRPVAGAGMKPVELIGLLAAALVAFALFFASPVAGLVAVILLVTVAAVLLVVRYRS